MRHLVAPRQGYGRQAFFASGFLVTRLGFLRELRLPLTPCPLSLFAFAKKARGGGLG